jgi:hypothetical protein
MYQTTKSIQHSRAVKMTAKAARVVVEAYKTWREIIDESRQVRDTYRNIKDAWTGLKESTTAMWDYYRELDWSSIKFTNASALLPASVLVRMDVSLGEMQYAAGDYLGAIEKLAVSEEQLQKDFHYRDKVPGLQTAYQTIYIASSMIMIGTTQAIGSTVNESAQYLGAGNANLSGMKNPDEMSRLSCLAHSARNWVENADIRQSYANLYVAANWFQFVQGEARDWVTYEQEMARIASGGPSLEEACSKAVQKSNFAPLIGYFSVPHVFERSMPQL